MSARTFEALQVPDYRRFLGMRVSVTLATQIIALAISWQVYDITNSKLALGLVGLAEAIPAILISLYAGHIADKNNRKSIVVFCILALLSCAVLLFSLTFIPIEAGNKDVVLLGIYTSLAMTGVARGFLSPANFAFLPQLLDKELLPNAITWNASAWEVATVVGLGAGGVLYGFAGVRNTYLIAGVLLLIGLFFLLQIARRPTPAHTIAEPALVRIREGLRFVRNNPLMLNAIVLDMFAVLFGGAVALLPVYAKDILHVGPEGLGFLRAAVSLGAISMAFVVARFRPGKSAGKMLLASVACFGLCIVGFGLSTHYWLSFAFLFFSGVFDEVSVYIRTALAQHLTPNHLKGRVSSVNSIFITSSNEIGAFESGVTAQLMGTVPAAVFGGLMCIGVVAITWWKAPALREMDMRG